MAQQRMLLDAAPLGAHHCPVSINGSGTVISSVGCHANQVQHGLASNIINVMPSHDFAPEGRTMFIEVSWSWRDVGVSLG
jgi:hypothetical protein